MVLTVSIRMNQRKERRRHDNPVMPLYSYEVTDRRRKYMKPGREGRWRLKDSGEKVICRAPTFAAVRQAYAALCECHGWPSV
jgi:hypothetical protein